MYAYLAPPAVYAAVALAALALALRIAAPVAF